jgi:hypothetical protein
VLLAASGLVSTLAAIGLFALLAKIFRNLRKRHRDRRGSAAADPSAEPIPARVPDKPDETSVAKARQAERTGHTGDGPRPFIRPD